MAEEIQTRAAASNAAAADENNTAELYARANKLNAKLASSTDAALISEGRKVGGALVEFVRARVQNFDDFVQRVTIADEFALTESRQLAKNERELQRLYMRGASLLEACDEAEQRAQKKRK
jgi:hypothetical protein